MRALEETRSSPEITIGRAIAIEHLGALATRLRSFAVQQKEDGHSAAQPLPLVSIPSCDVTDRQPHVTSISVADNSEIRHRGLETNGCR